jgi:anti-sigma regulatory factor (Ser/Thr protein kinase)/serine/threonine protein phosphatase PrpC
MQQLDCRRYRISRRSDVQIAAVSVQRADYYPGLTTLDRAALGTVIAELGSNILKYGVEGAIEIRRVQDGEQNGVLVEAHDQGPGIPDVERALQEHFTTGNTLGLGLPAVQRMSDELTIDTTPGEGTRVRALRWVRPEPSRRQSPIRVAAAPAPAAPVHSRSDQPPPQPPRPTPCKVLLETRLRPCYPERLSGDQILTEQAGELWLQGIVDGCGHGPEAHAAAAAVVEAVRDQFQRLTADHDGDSPVPAERWLGALLHAAHERAKGTRGGAIGLTLVDARRWELWFSGIGNTRIVQLRPRGWSGVSRDGQIGQRFPTPLVQSFSLRETDTVVQCSDGLRESELRALRQSIDPALPLPALADRLMQHALRTDDASVLVLRCQP